jgi:hypothetical protein
VSSSTATTATTSHAHASRRAAESSMRLRYWGMGKSARRARCIDREIWKAETRITSRGRSGTQSNLRWCGTIQTLRRWCWTMILSLAIRCRILKSSSWWRMIRTAGYIRCLRSGLEGRFEIGIEGRHLTRVFREAFVGNILSYSYYASRLSCCWETRSDSSLLHITLPFLGHGPLKFIETCRPFHVLQHLVRTHMHGRLVANVES